MTQTDNEVSTRRPSSLGQDPMGLGSASLASLTVVLWGGTAVANQFALDVLPTVFVGGARFGLAALFMVLWCLVERSALGLPRMHWKWAGILGLFLFAQIGLFNIGTAWSSASHASILVNTYIFWVAVWEHFLLKTIRLRWWQLLGLALAGGGCLLLFLSTAEGNESTGLDQPSFWGDAALAFSGLVLSIKIMVTKAAVRHVKPGPLILWHDVTGTTLFFLTSYLLGEKVHGEMTGAAWAAILYGGLVVSGFCFGANAWLLRRHGASQVSVFSFGTPICGVALGVLLRGDQLSAWLILAGICVACGIFLVNRLAPNS